MSILIQCIIYLLITILPSQQFQHIDMNADDLDINESAGRLFNETTIKEQPEIPFCGCLSVRYYQPFFDVDTNDVISRISSAVFYCNREQNFLGLVGDKPDAYGPFWVK